MIEKLVKEAPRFLRPGGYLILEIGYGQKDAVIPLFSDVWASIACRTDLAGIPRVIEAMLD